MSRRTKSLANKQASGDKKVVNPKFAQVREKKIEPIVAKNDFQRDLIKGIKTKQIVVAKAPAGTGKTYITMGMSADYLMRNEIEQIILTRPAVGMGKTLGLLKGDLEDKFNPYLAPLIEVFTKRYSLGEYETQLRAGNISLVPLEYVRGRNIRGVCILDEAQNTTPEEMFALITRVTEEGKLFIIGDPVQTDLKTESGLVWLYNFVDKYDLHDYIEIVEATSDEIVRSGLCKAFVKAMEIDNGK